MFWTGLTKYINQHIVVQILKWFCFQFQVFPFQCICFSIEKTYGSFCKKEGLLFTSFDFIVLLIDTTIPLLQNIVFGDEIDFYKDCINYSISIFFVDVSIALFLSGKSSFSDDSIIFRLNFYFTLITFRSLIIDFLSGKFLVLIGCFCFSRSSFSFIFLGFSVNSGSVIMAVFCPLFFFFLVVYWLGLSFCLKLILKMT